MSRYNRMGRAGGILALVVLVGCGNDYQDLCQRVVDCYKGNEADVDACVVDAETERDEAAVYDCEDQYDALIECIDSKFQCGDDEDEVEDACEDEDDELDDCIDKGSDLD